MPDPYLGMRYRGTELAHGDCERIEISIADVRSAIEQSDSEEAKKVNQFWHYGQTPQGFNLKILVAVNSAAGEFTIITVYRVRA